MKTNWTTLELTDGDGTILDRENTIRALREYRATGAMVGALFAAPLPGQDPAPEAAWTWGPQPEQIDWAGFPATDPYDLVATGDIARLAGVDRATVGQWQHRDLLPAPVATTSGGKVWLRSDIETWLRATGRVHEPSLEQ